MDTLGWCCEMRGMCTSSLKLTVSLAAIAVLSLAIAAACGVETEPSQTAAPGSTTPLPFLYCLPRFNDSGVAGGEVESGPFTFDLALYTDPAIKSRQEADHPSRASDVPGVGWRATWTYDGPTTTVTGLNYGLLGDLERAVPSYYEELGTGQSMGVRDGGGVVYATDGDRIGLGTKVRILEGTYGAVLFFTLEERGGEIAACDVTVAEWTE